MLCQISARLDKRNGSSNFDLERYKKLLDDDDVVMVSAKFLWSWRDFVPEYHHAKFGGSWTRNEGDTEGQNVLPPPPQPIPK